MIFTVAVATDRQLHEDQEYSSSSAHCKCNDPGIFVFVSVLILAMIQDQALVASKHLLVETEDKNLVDNAEGPPVDIGTKKGQTEHGNDYRATCPGCVCCVGIQWGSRCYVDHRCKSKWSKWFMGLRKKMVE